MSLKPGKRIAREMRRCRRTELPLDLRRLVHGAHAVAVPGSDKVVHRDVEEGEEDEVEGPEIDGVVGLQDVVGLHLLERLLKAGEPRTIHVAPKTLDALVVSRGALDE